MGIEQEKCLIAVYYEKSYLPERNINQEILDFIEKLPLGDQMLCNVIKLPLNGKYCLVSYPCGSKDGWEDDEYYTDLRTKFIEFFSSFNYEDGSSPIQWVEVSFGELGQFITRGNCGETPDLS